MKLQGQVALVTGASRGLGLAIARSLSREGAAVSCVARPSAELEGVVAELGAAGGEAMLAPADVRSSVQVEAAVRATVERWGRLDVVVLNAGTWLGGAVHETSEETWDLLLDLNLKGAFLTLHHATPWLMRHGGTVVGIASLGGWVGQPNASAYAASKWGLRGLLESVALELKPHRVRVSIVSPHQMQTSGPAPGPGTPERDRRLDPEDVAAVVTLACTAPSHVSVGNVTVWPLDAGIRSEG